MLRSIACGALAALIASAGTAAAQGIALFGDARLGLGYNIDNDGGVLLDEQPDGSVETPDDFRGVSRVRFGVNMTGESESGIVFGAEIRADNAIGGQGGTVGQTEGSVFVSGAWGTLTMGDTNGADEQWVGDLNEIGLTCLGCQNETFFFSNGGAFGGDDQFVAGDERPTIRYDYDIAGFGISLSSNRDLTDIGIGGGWTGELGGGAVTVGLGYYDFSEWGDADDLAGHQWSGAIGGSFAEFNGKVIYTKTEGADVADLGQAGLGLGAGFGPWGLNGYYFQIVDADIALGDLEGLQSYGIGVNYDLGGGAQVQSGIASVWSIEDEDDGFVVADFGIGMAF